MRCWRNTFPISESRESEFSLPSVGKVELNSTISLSHKTKESLLALAWREIALLRTKQQNNKNNKTTDYAEKICRFVLLFL